MSTSSQACWPGAVWAGRSKKVKGNEFMEKLPEVLINQAHSAIKFDNQS
jgi:hypothetical protein